MGSLETDSLWSHRDRFAALSPDPLTQGNRVPCVCCNSGDFQAGPFLLPVCAWAGGGAESGLWAHPASPLPSGLQHNRIWEIGADTFSQLTSLQAL